MGLIKEFENGRSNSFEDNDQSLNYLQYMNGSLQPNSNENILIYKWNRETQSNERVWVKRGSLDILN